MSPADFVFTQSSQRLQALLRRNYQHGNGARGSNTPIKKKSGGQALRLALCLMGILWFAAGMQAQVTITSPGAGSTVASPIHVTASARSSHRITFMRVYLDNVSKYAVAAASLSASVATSAGSHHLVVQAWDSAGKILKASETFTVTTSTTTTVLKEIQQWTGWRTCGNCGNTGGDGLVANYSMVRGIGYPTLSGSSAEFKIGGTHPYANGYWYFRQDTVSKAFKSLRYEFDLFVPAGLQNAPQAIEFECQQRLNGYVYNFGWQALYPGDEWRVFNYTLKRWENSGIRLTRFAAGKWHHIVAEYHNDPVTHTTYHDALTIDGVRHPVSIKHAATRTTSGNEFTNAFQLDLNGTPTPYKVYVDNLKITYVK
ncbi:MAG TPA: Ig-like domain-containing protein [Candidatus Angelobacter sp.]|nr:Ig-like domain-containing protein [Candidatus Angelobacter sp.]